MVARMTGRGTMNGMTAPDVWSDQGRALTVGDMENMPDDEFAPRGPTADGRQRPLTAAGRPYPWSLRVRRRGVRRPRGGTRW